MNNFLLCNSAHVVGVGTLGLVCCCCCFGTLIGLIICCVWKKKKSAGQVDEQNLAAGKQSTKTIDPDGKFQQHLS